MLNDPKSQQPYKLIYSHPTWRFFELIPGILTWSALVVPVIISILIPDITATLIIIYAVYWWFKSVKLTINLYRSYKVGEKALKTDWAKLLTYIENPTKLDYTLRKNHSDKAMKEVDMELNVNPKNHQIYSNEFYLKKQIELLKKAGQFKKPSQVYQAILFPTYKESYDIVYQSVRSYLGSNFNSKQIIFVFAGEENDQENALEISEKIEAEFGKQFKKYIFTLHPKDLPGEIRAKSGNITWAAKELQKYLDHEKIAYDDVILSVFDADTLVHPEYFNELTYKYLITKNRTRKGYQPIPMFNNNIWDVPVFNRMVALCCTFARMAESLETEKYKSFSSRSLSFQTAVEINYWDPSIIPEDSREYWSAYICYSGDYELITIYTPVYMDAVLSSSYMQTIKSQYKQMRRWAWGVCDFPFIVINLWRNPQMKLSAKLYQMFDFLINSFFWATGPLLITFVSRLPILLNEAFSNSVFGYNLPYAMSNLLTLASLGLLGCGVCTLKIIPKHTEKKLWGKILMVFQWVLFPIVSIVFSSIPALEAQTRLIFNWRLEFQVTPKSRKELTS